MKKVLFGLLSFVLIISLTGCGKETKNDKNEEKTFTIICTSPKDDDIGFDNEISTTYSFNKEQIATSYSSTAVQKFNDKETYDIYKEAQEQNVNDTSDENVKYDLKSNDEKLELIFTMTIFNLDKTATTEEEKATLKASNILKSSEDKDNKCVLNGITKEELK